MKNIKLPYRYDYVGSFLRPDDLKKIRADYEAGKTTYEALKEAEDTAVRDLVAKQKAAGYKLLTDGEFRRKTWYLDFMWGFEGVSHSAPKGGIPFHDVLAVVDDTYLTGKLKLTGTHPFVEHFRFVQALEDENTVAKQTIPSPAQFYEQMIFPMNAETTNKIYPNREELLEDVAKIYRAFIKQLYDAGCRNLQLDDCSWGVCVDPAAPFVFGVEPETTSRLRANRMISPLQPTFAAATTIPPGPAGAAMSRSQSACLHMKMSMPTIWSSMTRVPAVLSRCVSSHRAKKSFWD